MERVHGNYEHREPKSRHFSDDVTSLDSWSDLNDRESRRSRHSSSNDGPELSPLAKELVLNPARLQALPEPPEPKMVKVKLHKSEASPTSRHNRFFHVPTPSSSSPRQQKAKKLLHKHRHKSTDSAEEDLDYVSKGKSKMVQVGNHVSDRTRDCDCNDCEASTTEATNFKSSKPSYIKQTRNPLQLRKRLKEQSDNTSDPNDIEQTEKMKNKLMSVWNNVKYGWTMKTKTNFEKDSPIFLLGSCYHRRPDDEDPEPGQAISTSHCIEQFKQDFQSRLWFTYRRDFQALPYTKLTTDCGWGCMLRSSQMMLAQAFIIHFLGRDWRLHYQTREQETFYRHIIQWFGDSVSDQCPFSVHRLAEIGKAFGKQPGEWYGPSSVAYILRDALSKAALSQPVLKDICIYVAQDCTVYKQDVIKLCTARPRNLTSSVDSRSSNSEFPTDTASNSPQGQVDDGDDDDDTWKRSVIILVPVRLGGEEYNTIYSPCIKNLMAQEMCIGMIGGKPKHSLYFIGWQEDKLIYLDPHFCQDFVDTLKRDFKIESFHCFSPRKVSLSKMDPSATLGFYCRNKADFDKFILNTEQMVTPKRGSGVYPMFVFQEGQSADLDINDLNLSTEKYLKIRTVTLDENGRVRSATVDSEEFVVL